MKRISLKTALESPGEYTLASEVYDAHNLIMKRGTPLTKPEIIILHKLGIMTVLVNEGEQDAPAAIRPLTDDEINILVSKPIDYKPGETDKAELEKYTANSKYKQIYNVGIDALEHADVDTVIDVSKELSDKISSSSSILSELEDLQQGCDTVVSHSLNVATMAIAVGLAMGMKTKDIETLGAAGMLHDVGKMYIDKLILDKPAKLTDSEYEVMKTHSKIGSRKLEMNRSIDSRIRQVAMQHHENDDGSGYPNRLRHDDILLESRIIHVCDVYEAMVAKRCYKEGMLPGLAMEFVMSKCGTMFDKNVLDVFVHTVPAYKTGDRIVLSSGEHALVIHGTQKNSLRPVIRFEDSKEVVDLYTDMRYLNCTITGVNENAMKEASIRT